MIRIIILFLFAPISFTVVNSTVLDEENTMILPPGCVKVLDSLYADQAEVSNIAYQEYQFWTKRIFGDESKEYQETLLDTVVWEEVVGLSKLSQKYHVDEKYSNNPVVGVTLVQAKLYTIWRTERVMEKILIDSGIMEFDREQNSSNYFTFEKFLNGNYIYVKGKVEFMSSPIEIDFVEYKIPNSNEWKLISGIERSIMDSFELDKANEEIIKRHSYLCNTMEFNNSKRNKSSLLIETGGKKMITSPTRSFGQNRYGMYGVIGNVSEMIDEDGLSKGENWQSSVYEFSTEKVNDYGEPNCWTGFRNVCYMKKIKIRNGS